MRGLARQLPELAKASDLDLTVQRDVGHLVRARVSSGSTVVELDVIHEPVPDLEPATEVEGVVVESLTDLRANKLTCILSRSEPRDLVDLLFLHRAGFRAEDDLKLAAEKDAGIDPGVLAWLLAEFPTEPMPRMLEGLTRDELIRFRDDLASRLRKVALGS